MSLRKLTVACDDYDYLRPLREGSVQAAGVDLNLVSVECGTRHHRMQQFGEYDACEFSMGSYLVARSLGIESLQAVPFFPRRMFCHRFCFVRSDSTIANPEDIKGKRIGILGHQNSLALVVKAIFMHDYGVSMGDVTWVTMRDERVDAKTPSGVTIERAPRGATLEELLLSGEIDVMVAPDLPRSFLNGDGSIRRLFPNHERDEREYYRRTGIFPIMHVLVIKKELLERDPWIAASLYDAFAQSRKQYDAFIAQPHGVSLVWSPAENERALFGKSPYYQGLRENRRDIECLIDFAREQGMLAGPLCVDDIFTRNTLDT